MVGLGDVLAVRVDIPVPIHPYTGDVTSCTLQGV
jgi:hypothetical protein